MLLERQMLCSSSTGRSISRHGRLHGVVYNLATAAFVDSAALQGLQEAFILFLHSCCSTAITALAAAAEGPHS